MNGIFWRELMASEAQKVSGQNNDNHVFIPKPEYTKGQPAPIAANNGLSFMSFDRNGDCLLYTSDAADE